MWSQLSSGAAPLLNEARGAQVLEKASDELRDVEDGRQRADGDYEEHQVFHGADLNQQSSRASARPPDASPSSVIISSVSEKASADPMPSSVVIVTRETRLLSSLSDGGVGSSSSKGDANPVTWIARAMYLLCGSE